jgi:hypothetical protein
MKGWNDLGTIYLVMDGDVEKSREAFKKAVALDPNFLGEAMSVLDDALPYNIFAC